MGYSVPLAWIGCHRSPRGAPPIRGASMAHAGDGPSIAACGPRSGRRSPDPSDQAASLPSSCQRALQLAPHPVVLAAAPARRSFSAGPLAVPASATLTFRFTVPRPTLRGGRSTFRQWIDSSLNRRPRYSRCAWSSDPPRWRRDPLRSQKIGLDANRQRRPPPAAPPSPGTILQPRDPP